MTSAGLTASSSASSLTVIVVGSSIAPRSRGSITCTCEFASPSRRGGLRGPRRPRVPLLLLATGASFERHRHARGQLLAQVGRERGLERPAEGALRDGLLEAIAGLAEISAASGETTRRVELDGAIGRPHDTHQLTF